jgi:hypothetical protein
VLSSGPPSPPAPSAGCPGCGPDAGPCGDGSSDRYKDVPPVAVLPRVGWFLIPPSGPGYYSLADQCHDNYRQGPPKYPYPRVGLMFNPFFDVDWRYLDDPKNTEHDFFDFLKRQRFGPNDLFLFTTGGEFRARYNYEGNSRLQNTGPLAGQDNNYDLFRVRVYGDLWITENFRAYAEFLSATSPDFHQVPLVIDREPADLLNAFVDVRTLELFDKPVWLRVGRQELLYGSQRLISPLDWANTRRTFQGVKLFRQSENFDLDAFLVQPVIPNAFHFSSVDNNQVFAGLWGTYKFKPGTCVDLYYLMLDNTNPTVVPAAATGAPPPRTTYGATTTNTIGSRLVGDKDNWLWDLEGMSQFGSFSGRPLSAWAGTAGGGYYFKDVPWTPTVCAYYDYASGTRNPSADGIDHTFNQLFPFGHYYFGWLDLVGRRNIHDISAFLTTFPTNWVIAQLQVHNFWLDSSRDALYNAAGAPIRQDVTGAAGSFVGTELDQIINFHLSKHADVLVSYSYMFAGRFIRQTATTRSGGDNPQALYFQFSYRW